MGLEAAQQIDNTNQREADRFFQRLDAIMSNLARAKVGPIDQLEARRRKKDVSLEPKDIVVRQGGDPARNVRDKDREQAEVHQIILPGGDTVYLSNNPQTNQQQLVVPPQKPIEQIPELLAELEFMAKTQEVPKGTLVNYKPSGQMSYEKVYPAQVEQANLTNVTEQITSELGSTEQITSELGSPAHVDDLDRQIDEVIEKVTKNIEQLQKFYNQGLERHQRTVRKLQETLGEAFLTQFSPPVQLTTEKIGLGQRWESLTQFVKNLLPVAQRQDKDAKMSKQEMIQFAEMQQTLAQSLFTLAQKADSLESPGAIKGGIYQLETLGPGYFGLKDAEGNALMTVRQKSFLSPPEIQTSENLSLPEMRAIQAQVDLINQTLGERTITEYISQSTPQDITRTFGNFTPGPIAKTAYDFGQKAGQKAGKSPVPASPLPLSPLQPNISLPSIVTPEDPGFRMPNPERTEYER